MSPPIRVAVLGGGATCMSSQSRNRRVGEELARDERLEQIDEEMQRVAEGVKTARTVMELAGEHEVTLPICCEVDLVVDEGRHPRDAYAALQRERDKSEQHQVV